jgi:hypothetical protein
MIAIDFATNSALCGDLEGLNDTRDNLLLQARVLTLDVLTDNDDIKRTMTCGDVGQSLARNDLNALIKVLSHLHVT